MKPSPTVALLFTLLGACHASEERVWALVTAYCPCRVCCGRDSPGITATGRNVVMVRTMEHHWGIAADWRRLPPGTRVVVPGYTPSVYFPPGHAWEVDDTGRAMIRSGNRGVVHVDVRFIHHRSAVKWGRRWMWITIIKEE